MIVSVVASDPFNLFKMLVVNQELALLSFLRSLESSWINSTIKHTISVPAILSLPSNCDISHFSSRDIETRGEEATHEKDRLDLAAQQLPRHKQASKSGQWCAVRKIWFMIQTFDKYLRQRFERSVEPQLEGPQLFGCLTWHAIASVTEGFWKSHFDNVWDI